MDEKIKQLEQDIELEKYHFSQMEKHPTNSNQFRNAMARQREKILNMETELSKLINNNE